MAFMVRPSAAFMVPEVNARQQKRFRAVNFALMNYTDSELRDRYRFGRESINYIANILREDLERPTQRSHALNVHQQLMIAFRFYASGSFLQVIGDTMGVDKNTVSRVIVDVTDALVKRKNEFIKWPTQECYIRQVQDGFFALGGFPSVLGCIDGTHIRIQAPTRDEPAYVNRKGYHSINVQAVCDHEGKFTNVCAKWPGSTHDSHIFRTSTLCEYLERSHTSISDGFLLGDSGYPCRPFLQTPYMTPQGNVQQRYNDSLCATRATTERTFGRWKRRFHVLHSEIRMSPRSGCQIVLACAVLHNISILLNEPLQDDNDNPDEQPTVDTYGRRHDGRGIRDHIANTFFSS
ncbi:putative nuclease HARBI1 [Haliotis cracherodii]|uniref:putative nuclease HARBI1 n=1 Tax=Haliotis cracherodii TaxID=6455 RepID=UPI0039EB2540